MEEFPMSVNPHTGDQLRTKETTDKYRHNWDIIFKKKADKPVQGDTK